MEDMHKLNFVHRDIKPDNFLVGYGDRSNKVHTIDFGLSKKFTDFKN
jgi:serine/threonine protein kinase